MTDTCIVCPVYRPDADARVTSYGLACVPCRNRLAGDLADLARLFPLLQHAIVPGSSGAGERVSGSREAPLPVRVDLLDLGLPPRSGVVHDPHGDQTGAVPIASVLDQWVRDWHETIGGNAPLPVPTVPSLVGWLRSRDRFEWALTYHAALDEFAREIRQMAGALRSALCVSRPTIKFTIPCPRCEVRALVRDAAGGDYVECAACHTLWTEAEYERLVRLLVAEVQEESA